MAEQKNKEKAANQAKEQSPEKVTTEVATSELSNTQLDASSLNDMEVGHSITFEYLKLEKGDVRRFFVIGFITQTIDGEQRECVCLIDSDNRAYISASHNLVNNLNKIYKGDPVPVQIVFTGVDDTKNKDGEKIKVNKYEINRLTTKN
jgi:hypothetical protein